MDHVVVVGAGLAGSSTAKFLRAGGFRGRVTLVGKEPYLPYDRPPLTKQLLAGTMDSTVLTEDWADLKVDVRTGVSATGLTEGTLHTSAGDLDYDRLVIATGARPRSLPMSGEAPAHTIRTVDDAMRLRERLTPGSQVVVVGAGWIGAETASTAAALGCRVHVVEAAEGVLPGCGFGTLGRRFEKLYAESDVGLQLGTKVVDIGPNSVALDDGSTLPADVVVLGVGSDPDTAWLSGSGIGLGERGAIQVNSRLQTTLPQVYAVGDCSAYLSRRYGGPVLIEHWAYAANAPSVVADNILGGDREYDDIPYFWSRQFGKKIQYLGRHSESDLLIPRGQPENGSWSACWVRHSEVTAVLSVGRPREIIQARKLLASAHTVDEAALAQPEIALTDCRRQPRPAEELQSLGERAQAPGNDLPNPGNSCRS